MKGCLAHRPAATVPDFGLTDEARHAIRQFLVFGANGAGSDAPTYRAERRLDQLGCTACHARNGRGGVFAKRITRFVPLGSDTTVQDVAPPDLSGIGEKLLPESLRGVVEGRHRSRPWMHLKMPRFPAPLVEGLADGLVLADGCDPADVQPAPPHATPELVETGRLLVGSTGLGCASCHDVAGIPSTGVRGPDLAGVFARVRRDWFTRWMFNPQDISPGTRMPSVFFEGKSAAPQFLDGDPDGQLTALWAYLSRGERIPLPVLGPSPDELVEGGEGPNVVPKETPLLVRGYLGEHGGIRGIALGFPEGTHFGFDSERCRLVSVWQGPFLERQGWFDAGRGGAERDGDRILGDRIWQGPEGSLWAIGRREDNRVPKVRLGDERLGRADGSPATRTALSWPARTRYEACWAGSNDSGFAYRLEFAGGVALEVEDRPAPLVGGNSPAFRRHLTVTGAPADRAVWLRVAQGHARTSVPGHPRAASFLDLPFPLAEEGEGGGAVGSPRAHRADRAAWVSWPPSPQPSPTGGGSGSGWLITVRGAPEGSQWVIRDDDHAGSDANPTGELTALWLRLAPAARFAWEMVFVRQERGQPADFQTLDDLLRQQPPLMPRR
jgi:hypothetical protein